MLQQSERMESLINDLLSLSKIELQEHVRPTIEVDLKEIINHVIKLNLELIKKKKIKIESNIEDDVYKMLGDRSRLIEIFTNLINNAYKYSEVETVIKISLINKKNTFLFSIKDQGVGIPKKYISRITERFFRVDPARSKDGGGTGLGLAIVKHIVNQHRATMDIISTDGKGTEFTIEFPKA